MTHSIQVERVKRLKGVAIFAILVVVIHFTWKFTVTEDELNNRISWLGIDLTTIFEKAADTVTDQSAELLSVAGVEPERLSGNRLQFEHGRRLRVDWSCTGLKQAVVFTIIVLVFPGRARHKLWYIPAGLMLIWAFNVVRITAVAAFFSRNPESFDFLHEYLFKYLFYGLIFLLWLIWVEKFVPVTTQESTER